MKGFMRSLRYITSIFEEEREPEIQIGGPTDVKHVSHIGWDGPTASAPTWMSQFKNEGDNAGPESNDREISVGSELPLKESPTKRKKTKNSRRNNPAGESSVESPRNAAPENKRSSKRDGRNNDMTQQQQQEGQQKSTRKKKPKGTTKVKNSKNTTASTPEANSDQQ